MSTAETKNEILADQSLLEAEYAKLGWWKGPLGTQAVERQVRDFWLNAGPEGSRWLVRRLRGETHADVLHAAASILADIGCESVQSIFDELNQKPAPEQAKALLMALGWVKAPTNQGIVAELRTAIQRWLGSRDSELREAAVSATASLPAGDAIAMLQSALANEADEEVRKTIADAIAERRTP